MSTALLLSSTAVVGYLVGAVSPATLLARRRGVDLASVGSGNPGATNAGRILGLRVGVVVGLADMLKGTAPAALAGLLDPRAGLAAGLAAVLGHVTSPFLGWRGGKGAATSAGAVLGAQPVLAPVVLGVWIIVALVSRWVALASISAAVALPVGAWALGRSPTVVAWAATLGAIVLVRHHRNIRTIVRSRRH